MRQIDHPRSNIDDFRRFCCFERMDPLIWFQTTMTPPRNSTKPAMGDVNESAKRKRPRARPVIARRSDRRGEWVQRLDHERGSMYQHVDNFRPQRLGARSHSLRRLSCSPRERESLRGETVLFPF